MAPRNSRFERNLTPPRSLAPHITSFVLYLKSMGRADKTVRMYRQAVEWFAAEYLATGGQPPHTPDTPGEERYTFDPITDWEDVQRTHIRGWLACLFTRDYTDSYVNNQYRCLQQFFRWFAEDEEVPNIMLGMTPPRVAEKPVPVFADEEIQKIFATVTGRDIWSRRDLAILLLLRDTGMRLAELAGLQLDDVDVVEREATVTGKARKTRTVKYSFEAARALDKYLRMRAKHSHAHLGSVWIGPKGGLTDSGIYQLVQRRAAQAGLQGVHPHRFRHHFSHTWLDRGGAEGDLMELNGWDSPQMLRRYGRSAAAARARRGYDRIMGDQ